MQRVVLASGSPRRRELLQMMGVDYEAYESGFDEEKIRIDDPRELVEELARQKARKVRNDLSSSEDGLIVVGGDTVISIDDKIASKIESEDEVRDMIKNLSGREHEVITGICVLSDDMEIVESEVSRVKFHELSDEIVEDYVKSGKWRGFAGGYALQGAAGDLIEGYKGSLTNIIGLPVGLLAEMFEGVGLVVDIDPTEIENQIVGMKVVLND